MTPEMALEMVPDIGTIIDQVAVKVQLEIGRKNWKLVAVIYRFYGRNWTRNWNINWTRNPVKFEQRIDHKFGNWLLSSTDVMSGTGPEIGPGKSNQIGTGN